MIRNSPGTACMCYVFLMHKVNLEFNTNHHLISCTQTQFIRHVFDIMQIICIITCLT